MSENTIAAGSDHAEESRSLCAQKIELSETIESTALLRAALAADMQQVFYWRSPENEILIGLGSAVSWSLSDPGQDWQTEFRELSNRLSLLSDEISPDASLKAVFSVFFDPRQQSDEWHAFEPLRVAVPEMLYREHEGKAELQLLVGSGSADSLAQLFNDLLAVNEEDSEQRTIPVVQPDSDSQPVSAERQAAEFAIDWHDDEYRETVGRGLDLLQTSSLQKIVLSRRTEINAETDIDAVALVEELGHSYPDCFSILWSPDGDSHFVSATPERLARVQGQSFESAALAGTISAGDSRKENNTVLEELRLSQKDREEHAYVTDMILHAADSFCSNVSPAAPEILSLRNVHHLRTPIRGELNSDVGLPDVVTSLHPTPAVAGTPVQQAIDLIHELEPFTRGMFAGSIGWFDADGDGDAAVTIRSSLLHGRTALAFAGAGIISGSDVEQESAETRSKLSAIINAL